GAHRVRHRRVELGGIAALDDDVVLAQAQPHPSGEDVEPLESLVHPQRGQLPPRRVGDPVGLHRRVLWRERHDDEPVAVDDAAPHARVGAAGRHEVVDPDPQAAGEGDDELQAGLPFAGLQPRERARGHPGRVGQLGERPTACLAGGPQPPAHLPQVGLHVTSVRSVFAVSARTLAILPRRRARCSAWTWTPPGTPSSSAAAPPAWPPHSPSPAPGAACSSWTTGSRATASPPPCTASSATTAGRRVSCSPRRGPRRPDTAPPSARAPSPPCTAPAPRSPSSRRRATRSPHGRSSSPPGSPTG